MTKTIILLGLLLCCSLGYAQQADDTYFEGEVHFSLSVESLDRRISQKLLQAEIGNRMIGKVKRDKYLMYQHTTGSLGATKMILFFEKGIGYIEYENSDTITQFSIEENKDSLLSRSLNKEQKKVILGDTCSSITFRYMPALNFGMIEYVEATYYFNPRYRLDQEMYTKHNMSFWNQFVELGEGSISVKNEILTYPLYRTTYEVLEIIEKDNSEKEFELDTSKVIKRI